MTPDAGPAQTRRLFQLHFLQERVIRASSLRPSKNRIRLQLENIRIAVMNGAIQMPERASKSPRAVQMYAMLTGECTHAPSASEAPPAFLRPVSEARSRQRHGSSESQLAVRVRPLALRIALQRLGEVPGLHIDGAIMASPDILRIHLQHLAELCDRMLVVPLQLIQEPQMHAEQDRERSSDSAFCTSVTASSIRPTGRR